MRREVDMLDALALARSRTDVVEYLLGTLEDLNVRMGKETDSAGSPETRALYDEESCVLIALGDVVSYMKGDLVRVLATNGGEL